MASKNVTIGSRYTRANSSLSVYVVMGIVEKTGHLPHARLALEGGLQGEELLVSVSALGDRKLWRQVA
jgi:hypothetical protein